MKSINGEGALTFKKLNKQGRELKWLPVMELRANGVRCVTGCVELVGSVQIYKWGLLCDDLHHGYEEEEKREEGRELQQLLVVPEGRKWA